MAKPPEITQEDIDKSIIRQINVDGTTQLKNPAGTRQYTDAQIDQFSPERRASEVVAVKRVMLAESLRVTSISNQAYLDGEAPWVGQTIPEAGTPEHQDLLDNIFTESEIQDLIIELIPDVGEPAPEKDVKLSVAEDPGDEVLTADDGAGTPLPKDDNVPSIEVTRKQRDPVVIPDAVLDEFLPQLDPSAGIPPFKVPILVPIDMMPPLSMFLDPFTRQTFVMLFQIPGIFHATIHIPCGYAQVFPSFFPVTPVGPPPIGAIALIFIDDSLPYCGGSQPFDTTFLRSIGAPNINVEALKADIDPCDPNLPADQLIECKKRFNKDTRAYLGLSPLPVEALPVAPAEILAEAPIEQAFEIFEEDVLEDVTFGIDIIE